MEKLNMIKNTGLMTSISKLEDDNKDERNYIWVASLVSVVEGAIEYDSANNLYYCKNIIIPGSNLEIGVRVKINKVVKNMKDNIPYNYFCTDYNIIS